MKHNALQSMFPLAVLAVMGTGAPADQVVIYPAAADTDLYVQYLNDPTGHDAAVDIKEGYYKGSMWTRRGLQRFDIDALADLIAEASLHLYLIALSGHIHKEITEADLAAHAVTSDWEEYEATWSRRADGDEPLYWDAYLDGVPSYGPGGGDFDPQPAAIFTLHTADIGQVVSIDITQLVRDWQSGARPNYGLLIKFHEETQEVGDDLFNYRYASVGSIDSSFDERYPRVQVRLHIPGDLNSDDVVDQQDLGILLAAYQVDEGGDINGDGVTDQQDLGILLANYGRTLP